MRKPDEDKLIHTLMVVNLVLLACWTVLAIVSLILTATARAEEENVWVLCQPDSFVNIREKANKHSHSIGYALCGDVFQTDGTTRNGFLHLSHAPTESGDGWIAKGYVVADEPEQVDHRAPIEASGRVACRTTMGGSRRKWSKPGDWVTVYWMSPEWSVTSEGFILTKYIGAVDLE